jgi:polysaccharide biosynthesis protein PslH
MASKLALIVAPTFPYPIDGGNLVALHGYHLALRHAGYDEVHFLGFMDEAHPGGTQFEKVALINKPPKFTAQGLIGHALGHSLLLARYWSNDFAAKLTELVQAHPYKAVFFQHGYIAQYLKVVQDRLAPDCVRIASPEVLESRAFLTKSQLASNALMRLALRRESRILDREESEVFNGFQQVLFFSEEDKAHYMKHGGTAPAEVIRLGVDIQRYPVVPHSTGQRDGLTLAFFGAFSWFANTDALEYLLRDLWPYVQSHIPNATLLIAGREMPEWAYAHASDRLKVLGRVDSIESFLSGVDVVLSPIRIGGGIRLKILEALAYGRTVISTRIGLEGLAPEVARFVHAADTPEEFVRVLQRLSAAPDLFVSESKQACDLVRNTYDARNLSKFMLPGRVMQGRNR